MPNEYNVMRNEEVRYSGPFDFEDLYHHLMEWFGRRQYAVREKKFKDKIKPRAPIQREIEVEWEVKKDVDDYTIFRYTVGFRIVNVKDILVKTDEGEKKMFDADIRVLINADLVLDKQDKWETSPLLHFLKRFFEAHIYKSTLKHHETILYKEGQALYNEVKALLKLYNM